MKELKYPYDTNFILRKRTKIIKELKTKTNLRKIKIAVLTGSTLGELKEIIEIFLLDKGLEPVFFEGKYNRFYEEAVFENDKLIEFSPDFVYIHTSVRNIKNFPTVNDSKDKIDNLIKETYSFFKQAWESLKVLKCHIIQNNFEYLPYRLYGNSDSYFTFGKVNFINKLNELFCKYAENNNNFYLNDLNYQSSWFGLEKWHDYTMWYMFKYPFSIDAFPMVSNNISNIIKSVLGLNKKALICDLDNTLWGGVVGDDSKDGIKVGLESPEGMMYSEFQFYLKQLSERGILLNVCSKNDKNIAYSGFENEGNILSKHDFIVFKANWENKDKNVGDIISELNILPESAVFLDDNEAEREIVKNSFPSIEIPELSPDINYITSLDQQGYFELTNLSYDDKKRNNYYKENIKRTNDINKYVDYSEYLLSLKMISIIKPICQNNLERNYQLINKTNQFNLTAKRMTIEEVSNYISNENKIGFCSRLKDKYGDNGIVSTMLITIDGNTANVDLWVMSCRVFKRDLEKTIFDELVKQCIKLNVLFVKGYYKHTEKNIYVKNLYESLGFKIIEKTETINTWIYEIPKQYKNKNKVMEVTYEK